MLFEYFCKKCEKEFDKFVSMKDRHNVRCECGELATKLPARMVFEFKGDGFSSMENSEGKFEKYSKYR